MPDHLVPEAGDYPAALREEYRGLVWTGPGRWARAGGEEPAGE